jgi:hypothetical protein
MNHLKIGAITIGAMVLTVGLYFGFRPKPVEHDEFTAAQSACLANLAQQFQQFLEAQSAQQTAQMQQAIGANAHNKSQPNLDAALAPRHYRDKMTSVKFQTLYCE